MKKFDLVAVGSNVKKLAGECNRGKVKAFELG